MALLTFLPAEASSSSSDSRKQPSKRRRIKHQKQSHQSSWDQIKNILTCKQSSRTVSTIHDPSRDPQPAGSYSRLGSCGSICSFRDVVHGNTSRVVHRADNSPGSSSVGQETGLLSRKPVAAGGGQPSSSSLRSLSGSGRSHGGGSSSRTMQFRKLSGCYECHMIVDPSRYPIQRTSVCACSQCGEVFPKIESLEHHQAVRHAVSELGPDDSGKNIVEIIFKSSWQKKDNPICKIERILKVHNTQKTIQRFEDCRDAVKTRANANTKKNPRCAADGNELLRFHCTTLACALGARGSTSLCASVPGCGVCTVVRHGFQGNAAGGVRTTASSGRAHDCLGEGPRGRRAMLVCRVVAGRVRRLAPEEDGDGDGGESTSGPYDSVAGNDGAYSNMEELCVFNPRAILPCFVVIYEAMDSYV